MTRSAHLSTLSRTTALLVVLLSTPAPALAGDAAPSGGDTGGLLAWPTAPVLAADAASEEDADRVRRLVRTRRGMMGAHQALSVALIPVLGATAVMGTVNRARIDAGEGIGAAERGVHRALAVTGAVTYLTTGLLAVAAPNPYRDLVGTSGASARLDSSRLHRALAVVHAIVLGGLLVTGIIDANAPLSPDAYAVVSTIHAVEGWTMFTLVTISGITIAAF